jgi:hypothetical protein
MHRRWPYAFVAWVGVFASSCSQAPDTEKSAGGETTADASPRDDASQAAETTAADPLDGLWSGSWGGGMDGEVVFQPVLAEMILRGDRIELHGFRAVDRLAGTVRIDAETKRLHVLPDAADGEARPAALEFTYELAGDALTLTDADGVPILLQRQPFVRDPPVANAQVSFVSASMDEEGNLVTTEFHTLLAGRGRDVYYAPWSQTLIVEQVLLVEEGGLKKISLDDARGLMREAMPVAVTFRESGLEYGESALWEMQAGPPAPDSEAVERTFMRMLRPGVLLFILPASQLRPPP